MNRKKLYLLIIVIFLFPNTLSGYMNCGCMPILTTCSPYCCNNGAYCGPFGESCKYGCCGSSCDCGVDDFLDNYCEGTDKCYCVNPNSGTCYYSSTIGCEGADYWITGADCEDPGISCSICGYDSVDSYFTSNDICYYGCDLECKQYVGWEKSGCYEQSLGSCCDCTELGVVPADDNCTLQNCGGDEGDCTCQGCLLTSNNQRND